MCAYKGHTHTHIHTCGLHNFNLLISNVGKLQQQFLHFRSYIYIPYRRLGSTSQLHLLYSFPFMWLTNFTQNLCAIQFLFHKVFHSIRSSPNIRHGLQLVFIAFIIATIKFYDFILSSCCCCLIRYAVRQLLPQLFMSLQLCVWVCAFCISFECIIHVKIIGT